MEREKEIEGEEEEENKKKPLSNESFSLEIHSDAKAFLEQLSEGDDSNFKEAVKRTTRLAYKACREEGSNYRLSFINSSTGGVVDLVIKSKTNSTTMTCSQPCSEHTLRAIAVTLLASFGGDEVTIKSIRPPEQAELFKAVAAQIGLRVEFEEPPKRLAWIQGGIEGIGSIFSKGTEEDEDKSDEEDADESEKEECSL